MKKSLTGLTEQEVLVKRKQYGWNQTVKNETPWWDVLLRQFQSVFLYLLITAAGVSFAIGDTVEALLITLFLLADIILGFIQEYRAEKTQQMLRDLTSNRATVIRDANKTIIPSNELVPGDIVLLQAGDIIPADILFIEATELSIDESLITGESIEVPKHAGDIGRSSTVIKTGNTLAQVKAIGLSSAIGAISKELRSVSHMSLFESQLNAFSVKILRVVAITLVLIVISHSFINQGIHSMSELFVFCIALAVSVVPEVLPLITILSLSRGAQRLAEKHVIIKRLNSIEDLGGVNVLCSDKTGTLTQNQLEVAEHFTLTNDDMLWWAYASALPTDEAHRSISSFDEALIKLGLELETKTRAFEQLKKSAFDPVNKFERTWIRIGEKNIVITKGAPESLYDLDTQLSDEHKRKLNEWVFSQGKLGRRVLGIVTSDEGLNHSEFMGLISFEDPLKESAFQAVIKAETLGITLKMLTGDHQGVAFAVAQKIKLLTDEDQLTTGEIWDRSSEKEKRVLANKCMVFARVTPEQKLDIIRVLKATHQVGFLGEGINDAPALREANVGLVVQGASDVARAASDIILLDKNLLAVVESIQEGRRIYANTIKYLRITLTSNFGNFYSIAIASLFIPYLPMLPVQILLLNLLSDLPMVALSVDTVDENELLRPSQYNTKALLKLCLVLGAISSIFDLFLFGLFVFAPSTTLQTQWFFFSLITEIGLIFSLRTKKLFYHASMPSFLLVGLSCGVILFALLTFAIEPLRRVFSFERITLANISMTVLLASFYLLTTELVKKNFIQKKR